MASRQTNDRTIDLVPKKIVKLNQKVHKRNRVFTTNSNCLIPISLQSDGENI